MADFKEQLPEWHAEGIEPPQSMKDEGWKEGHKPPAPWFNWWMNRNYKNLLEIREFIGGLIFDVEDLRTDQHNHNNKNTLDKLSEVDEKLHFNGKDVGLVTSVNDKVGDVNLNADDVGAETPSGAQTKANRAEQNAKDHADTELEKKVDKVDGKGLSENDFTNEDKERVNKIDTIETNIENLQEDSHTHNNKNVLDDLSESDGRLQYNGQDVGIGDMTKDVYDTNNDGKVDVANNSEKLGNELPSFYANVGYVDTELSKKVNIADLEAILDTIDVNDKEARKEIIDIKLRLSESNVYEFLNKTGIGFFDLFEDLSNIDSSTTAVVNISENEVIFDNTKLLKFKEEEFHEFKNLELAIYDKERESISVIENSLSNQVEVLIPPNSVSVGDKFIYNNEVYTVSVVS